MTEKLKKYPVLGSYLLTYGATVLWSVIIGTGILQSMGFGIAISLFGFYPFVLTVLNLVFCFAKDVGEERKRAVFHIETATLSLGILFTLLLMCFVDIDFTADWPEVLTAGMTHSPVWTEAYPSVLAFLIIGMAGYIVLKRISFQKMPPLVIVLGISAMYLGMAVCILWVIQLFTIEGLELYLCLLPLNWIFICIRLMRERAAEWRELEETKKRKFDNAFLEKLNRKVMDSSTWPLWAFLFLWPLMGFAIVILALFGQRPDNIIRAWTETSQWNLSARVSPPSLPYDGHYLCTVAAGGHKKLVKPLRMGVRHGHSIVVNRQLCIANAFEQILEEQLPKVHRALRNFYDAYGLPLAQIIRSPYAADMIYIIMKPLEWTFLAIIYLTDVRPENRIHMQYIPPIRDKT